MVFACIFDKNFKFCDFKFSLNVNKSAGTNGINAVTLFA